MTQTPPPPAPAGSGYPVTVDLTSPDEIKWWLPLVSWLLVIPHVFVLLGLFIAAVVCELIALFTILFTKQVPEGISKVLVMTVRYNWRVSSYSGFLRNEYPAFEFDGSPQDPGTDPASLSVAKPAEYHRLLPLVKWLLAIPHLIVLWVLGIAVFFCMLIGFFTVLFTKKWPEGLRTFVIGYYRWQFRVQAYLFLLVDEYPPFSLE